MVLPVKVYDSCPAVGHVACSRSGAPEVGFCERRMISMMGAVDAANTTSGAIICTAPERCRLYSAPSDATRKIALG